jgi:peptide deformylase
MPIRPIVRLGHPTLRSVARALAPGQIGEAGVQQLIDDMIETMRAAHGVGLAAPQVGTALQLFVYELAPQVAAAAAETPQAQAGEEPSPAPGRAPGEPVTEIPLHVVINAMLTPQAGELVYDWEGCLSIPDLRGLVPRHPAVRVRGLDRLGQPLDYVARGFEARIVQHEFDHLNGVVFLDRMRDLKALAFRDEWERYMAAGAAEPPNPHDPQAPPARDSAEPVLAAAAPPAATPEVI